uniref:Uncharacterized protein n=1 Tax=Grammatophora oceanica TaxID=210454 RepID=A0A7S1UYP0_9STRA|mmetsp:Transcript_30014/g.44327  ORF Transcript_30014/g.44327 Transcript_30014/m.44327 type:complete len:189 (+) Transcript_30014:109-675(+)
MCCQGTRVEGSFPFRKAQSPRVVHGWYAKIEGGLFDSLWVVAMQHLSCAIWSGEHEFDFRPRRDDGLTGCVFVRWANGIDCTSANDGLECDVKSYVKMLFLLELACAIHKYSLYLWPAIGSCVSFSERRHRQLRLDREDASPLDGDPVLVLCPARYSSDPVTHEEVEPLIPAMVVFVESDVVAVDEPM